MRKQLLIVLLMITVLSTVAACGILQEPEEASGTIEAIPLQQQTEAAPTVEATAAEVESEDGGTPTADSAGGTTVALAETAASSATEAPPQESEQGSGELTIFRIAPAESVVRFELDEVLRGQPTTVMGSTGQVAGEIAFDLTDTTATQIGVIQINARTLVTDNNFRNRAIQNEILQTDAHEFITFSPTAVSGLPERVTVGEEITFTIDGQLAIREIAQPVTFEVTATAVSEDQLAGMAQTVIQRSAFDLRIPEVPQVADVEEEVELYIDFVAYRA